MRHLLAVVFVVALLVVASGLAVYADNFSNGDFENGTFSGWTLGGGTWYDPIKYPVAPFVPAVGDPGKSAITDVGTDARTLNNLNTVFAGNHAARVNNYDNGGHFTTLTQAVQNWTQDTIYFAWAAVLEEPPNSHIDPGGQSGAPHFTIKLTDTSNSLVLYDQSFDVYNPPAGVSWMDGQTPGDGAQDGGASVWKYCPWQVAELDTSAYHGDTFVMTVAAYDCGWADSSTTGHGGYAYVDQFGGRPPVPEPGTLALMALGLPMAGLLRRRKRS